MGKIRKTISVPEAGRLYFELGRNASYRAARRGEIPVVRFGAKMRVPLVALDKMLESAGDDPKAQGGAKPLTGTSNGVSTRGRRV